MKKKWALQHKKFEKHCSRSQYNFVKVQILNIFRFVGCTVSVATSNTAIEGLSLTESQSLEVVARIPVYLQMTEFPSFLAGFLSS